MSIVGVVESLLKYLVSWFHGFDSAKHANNSTEVLSVSGVLDHVPEYMDDHVQRTLNFRDRCLKEANKFRISCRETLKKEKMAGLGFAAGAFVGIAV